MLKVCQICAVSFTLKTFLIPLVDGMRRLKWDVTGVCSDGPEIELMRAQGYSIDVVSIARSMNFWAVSRSFFDLYRYFRKNKFDIVHVHTPVAAFLGRIAAKCAGVPVVVYTAHGFYFHEYMPRWKYKAHVYLERFGGAFTDLLFCQSAEDAAAAVKFKILPSKKVITIGNGVCLDSFDPAQFSSREDVRASIGIPNDAYVVGMVCRQVEEKGIGEFLSAVTRLALRYPNLYILLVGVRLTSDHSPGVDEQLAESRQLLGDRLVALGFREDIAKILAVMDLFCLPSWREGMPRTIIEAMAMGKPVVATNIRGSREQVIPGETGLLVPVRDPETLSASIEKFIIDPAWGRRLGQAGRRRALKLYDEKKIINLQLEVISAAAKRRTAKI